MMAYFMPHARLNRRENPVVHSQARASHFASNEVDSHIAVHQLDSLFIQNRFGADWGSVYYFQPKGQLAQWGQCQMVALEKSNKGIFYILYFFNEISEDVEDMIWNPRFGLEN